MTTSILFHHFIVLPREIIWKCSQKSMSHLYYLNTKQKALISAYCVVGNCATPPTKTVKKQGKFE